MVPFSPLDLTPQLWLDADDASTITSSSNNVSQWNDKSGNTYHVTQATGTAQPKTGTVTRNGRNVLDFDGTDDRLFRETDTALGRNVTGLTVYWVASSDNNTANVQIIAFATGTGTARVLSGMNSSSQFNAQGRTLDADSVAGANSSTLSTFTWYATCAVFDYANTDLNLYVDRTADGSNTSFQTATTTSNTDSLSLSVGSNLSAAANFNGQIAEILVYHSAHSSTDREKVFDYLDGKWGT
jgi:hypothetical protein